MANYEITVFTNKLKMKDLPEVDGGWFVDIWGIQSAKALPLEECQRVMSELGFSYEGISYGSYLDYIESEDLEADCATLYPEEEE